jgi:beta-mannosidase
MVTKIRWVFLFLILTIAMRFSSQCVLSWEFQHPVKKDWISMGESGTVQETLWKKGILPNPYIGENENEYQWIEDHEWSFRSKFFLSETLFNAPSVHINLPCVDTYAKIYVNGILVLQTENYFRPYDLAIKDHLRCGYNEVTVVFSPPALYHKMDYKKAKFHYPTPNDLAKIKVSSLTRKPQYQFGWDWALRMNTIGFPKPVCIEIPKTNLVSSIGMNTLSLQEDASLEMVITHVKNIEGYSFESNMFQLKNAFSQGTITRLTLSLKNPKLWWPSGMGDANLYYDTLRIFDKQANCIQEVPYTFGVRKVDLLQQTDQWGTSFQFTINGLPVFLKGANFIPPTVFNGITKDEEWNEWVRVMKESNFNAVRIWGGGDYASDAFLEACDRAGLMVWHDAMFACAMYPGDSAFLANVSAEFEYQIPRLTKHVSVILINGNNEVDVAWKNWGFQSQYHLDKDDQKVIESDYNALFKVLLPNTMAKYSNLPFTHTSPLSNWGKDEFYNHGTQHYWGVWHGADEMEGFAKNIGRFNAEYGFQSFPEFSTLSAFSNEEDWSLDSKIMKAHQKSYVGNGMILKHAKKLFGKPKDFKTFVYFSQLTQAYAVESAITGHRLDAPRCMGTLYWQLNDCWPAPTWSSIDYYGNWKSLQYKVNEIYKDLTVLSKPTHGKTELFVSYLNGKAPKEVTVSWLEFDLTGKPGGSYSKQINLQVFGSESFASYSADVSPKVVVVKMDGVEARTFLVGDFKRNPKQLLKASLRIVSIDAEKKAAVVELTTDAFLADCWIYSDKLGVHFENNFTNYLPGKHLVKLTFTDEIGDLKCMYR